MRRRMAAGLPATKGAITPISRSAGAFGLRRHQRPELGPRVDPELLVDPPEDVADGLGGEERALGDLAAGEARRGELGDPPLGLGQRRRGVRPPARPGPSSALVIAAQSGAPSDSKHRERLAERLVGESLLLPAAMEAALREQRPAALERHRQAVVRSRAPGRQLRDRAIEVASRPPPRAPPIARPTATTHGVGAIRAASSSRSTTACARVDVAQRERRLDLVARELEPARMPDRRSRSASVGRRREMGVGLGPRSRS